MCRNAETDPLWGVSPYAAHLPMTYLDPERDQGIALRKHADGVLILELKAPPGVIEHVGYRVGDIIISIGGVAMTETEMVTDAFDRLKADGGEVKMVVLRGGERKTMTLIPPP